MPPYVLYGVKYISLVSLAPVSAGASYSQLDCAYRLCAHVLVDDGFLRVFEERTDLHLDLLPVSQHNGIGVNNIYNILRYL